MSVSLATVTTQFLERSGLAKSTIRSYEGTLMPLLQEYGRWPIEVLDKQTLVEYLNSLNHLSYTTHHRHQAILIALFNFAVEQGYIPIQLLICHGKNPIQVKGNICQMN